MYARKLVGRSESHAVILEKLHTIASTDAEVLISGPSGVGKELYANYVHTQSYRKNQRFVPVNCGSLLGDLLENVLFGHVGGAFTGAKASSEGLVNDAEGGTLFLDEVDSLSVPCQIRLLRFLQDKQYRRLGENRLRQANVRIIAATNVDLEIAVKEERFRKDLFFRLRVVPVDIPPLRERPEDIPDLINVFTGRYAEKYKLQAIELGPEVIDRMKIYNWPGNIRELENCVAYLTCLQLQRPIQLQDLPLLDKLNADLKPGPEDSQNHSGFRVVDTEPDKFNSAKSRVIADFEKQYIGRALKNTNGNVSAAARMIGKNRRALFELMRKHEINPAKYRLALP
ncbi:MAG: sigma 54-interacting transcriptional regulator [Gammaproteobacteria bacterium]